jgi:hypothetical protein
MKSRSSPATLTSIRQLAGAAAGLLLILGPTAQAGLIAVERNPQIVSRDPGAPDPFGNPYHSTAGFPTTDVGADLLLRLGLAPEAVSLTPESSLELSSVAFPVSGSATTFRPPGPVAITPMTIDLPEATVGVPDGASTLLLCAMGIGMLFRALPQQDRAKA